MLSKCNRAKSSHAKLAKDLVLLKAILQGEALLCQDGCMNGLEVVSTVEVDGALLLA